MAAELTILPPVAPNSTATVAPDQPPPTKNQTNDTRVSSNNQQAGSNKICAQLPARQPQPGNDDMLSLAAATNYTGNANFCHEQQALDRAPQRDTFTSLVKTECSFRSSCSLDLGAFSGPMPGKQQRQQLLTSTNSTNNESFNGTQPTASLAFPNDTTTKLPKLLHGVCPLNRKLVEVVYKCRPPKFSRRFVCRGSQLNVTCSGDTRLLVANADFGASPNETKALAYCSRNESFARLMPDASAGVVTPVAPGPAAPVLNKPCYSNTTMTTLTRRCMFQKECILDVHPSVLGQTNCPSGQAEYLKLHFTCVDEAYLNTMFYGKNIVPSSSSPYSSGMGRSQQPAPTTFTSPNVPSSSLLSSASSSSTALRPFSSGPNQSDLVDSSLAPVSAPHQPPTWTSPNIINYRHQPVPSSDQILDLTGGYTMAPSTAIASPSLDPAWIQRYKVIFNRYQAQIVMLASMFAVLVVLIGLTIRSCVYGGSRHAGSTTKSLGGSSSGASSSSSSSGSSHGLMSGGVGVQHGMGQYGHMHPSHQNHQVMQSGQAKHGSCSESCFSLDDNNSPALDSGDGPLATVRPRLWTIYGNNQNQNNQSDIARNSYTTLRAPPRSFIGRPHQAVQIQQPPSVQHAPHCVAAASNCHLHNGNSSIVVSGAGACAEPTNQLEQHHQATSNGSNLADATDLFLAMAATSQHQNFHLMQQQQQGACWQQASQNFAPPPPFPQQQQHQAGAVFSCAPPPQSKQQAANCNFSSQASSQNSTPAATAMQSTHSNSLDSQATLAMYSAPPVPAAPVAGAQTDWTPLAQIQQQH